MYQFVCLPLGLSSAPWIFTKTTKPVVSYLQVQGVRLVIYLDDILLMHQSAITLSGQVQQALLLLEQLGLYKHDDQPTPRQDGEDNSQSEATGRSAHPTIRNVSSFVVRASSIEAAVLQAPLEYRCLQHQQNKATAREQGILDTKITLTPKAPQELNWWQSSIQLWNC